MINTLVLASGNKGKLSELQSLLAPLNIQVLPQSEFDIDDIEETGTTFIENAILKAKHASKISGLPALADDSGLCVNALVGAPGLFSARYALLHGHKEKSDTLNNEILLSKLDSYQNRGAYFVCCLALCFSSEHPLPLLGIGRWYGKISTSPRGQNGFGYDPIFIPNGKNCSAAELSVSDKQQLSHRSIALRQLLSELDNHIQHASEVNNG